MAVNRGKDGDVVHATPAVAVVNVEVGELGGTRELELLNFRAVRLQHSPQYPIAVWDCRV